MQINTPFAKIFVRKFDIIVNNGGEKVDWQKCMNQAMEYIENHLQQKIDYKMISQFIHCSQWEFRRMFSFIAQMPLSDYIRRRRLTRAAEDIRNNDKIMEVALRYGYDSQAAFSRAFRQMHGITPSEARNKMAIVKSYPCLTFKLVLMEASDMEEKKTGRVSIYKGSEVRGAIAVDMNEETIHKINQFFWSTKGNDAIGTTALPQYGGNIREDEFHLFRDLHGKKILEIGCGRGRSLKYLGDLGASELWGMDISNEQLKIAEQFLTENGYSPTLICSPMEKECSVPKNYFDYVYSVYGIGWTTNLEQTFLHIASYLKKDGIFIFSWSHPIHKCVTVEDNTLIFRKCYYDESWYSVPMDGSVFSLSDRKMSTYINALAKAGFVIEQMLEDPYRGGLPPKNENSEKIEKSQMVPPVFVIKARKL
jgi:AraC-like DNA-binding protein/SAM-dependent methyltransferase